MHASSGNAPVTDANAGGNPHGEPPAVFAYRPMAHLRAALAIGLVSALAGLAGGKGAETLTTRAAIGFGMLLAATVGAELILTEPMKDALAAAFGARAEAEHNSWKARLVRIATLALGIGVTIWLEELFRESPSEAASVVIQSLIVPAAMTYLWLRGWTRPGGRAWRSGAVGGALIGAALGPLIALALWISCLAGACASAGPAVARITSEAPDVALPAATVARVIYLVVLSAETALLLGVVGLAGIAIDRFAAAHPRRAFAAAAVLANGPFLLVAIQSEGSWLVGGAIVGSTLGWAAGFRLYPVGATARPAPREGTAMAQAKQGAA